MAKLNPNVIRRNDKVRIIDTRAFKRVGYPLTVPDLLKEVKGVDLDIDRIFVNKFKVPALGQDSLTRMKVRDALAYALLKQRGFGGDKRSVYLQAPEPLLAGVTMRVASVRSVMTGTYFAPSGWGSEDFVSGGLENQKPVRIAALVPLGGGWRNLVLDGYEFPVSHLEKIHETSEEQDD